VTLSSHGPDQVPWADLVTYSIGGVRVGDFAPGDTVADELSSCLPGERNVEGHTCPVSPYEAVAGLAPDVTIETAVPDRVGCNRFAEPEVPAGLTTATIRPVDERRDCFSDFAVTLYLNATGDVEWIDFALSGP
jgi:hypothetical protein